MARHGKKYLEAAKLIDTAKSYPIEEAIELVKKVSYTKFDETMELVFRLNVDPRHADQQLRGAIVLPNGTGKSKKVLVITQGPKVAEAQNSINLISLLLIFSPEKNINRHTERHNIVGEI